MIWPPGSRPATAPDRAAAIGGSAAQPLPFAASTSADAKLSPPS
jgi:hypothetical protein